MEQTAIKFTENIIEDFVTYWENGAVWMTEQWCTILDEDLSKYDYRQNSDIVGARAVCRVGLLTKHFDNGQLAWTIEFDEYGRGTKKKIPQFQKDGTFIALV